eukprot:Em0002g1317a
MQLASYEENFRCERVDKTKAIEGKLKAEEEFNAYKNVSMVHLKQLNKQVEDISLQLIEKEEVIKQFEVRNKEELKAALEENERLKRENNALITKLHTCNERLKCYYEENAAARRCSQSFEHYASSTEAVLQEAVRKLYTHLDATTIELEAAKEEIAVKVAQVKQYQKQVEAYKQQLDQLSVNSVTSDAFQIQQPVYIKTPDCRSKPSSEAMHPDHALRGQANCEGDGDNGWNPPSSSSQNAAPNDGDSEEDDSDDDLPPPMFHKPLHHPAVAHGMQKEGIPLTPLEASKLSVACRQMAHTIGSSAPDLVQTVNTAGRIDGDTSHVAAAIQRDNDYRGFEETDSIVPLDPNQKCPKCGKVFKKGRIQKYKRHVQMCGM